MTNYFELTNSLAIGGGTNDLIVVGGDLTLNSNVIAITVLGSDPLGSGSYRLFNYAGAKTGSFNPTPVFLSGAPGPASTARIDESVTNQVNLVVVVPIGTAALLTTSKIAYLPRPDYLGGDLLSYTLTDPYTSVTGSIHVIVLSGGDLTNGTLIICSFFDVFTELSMNSGLTWSPATKGSIPLILVGGTPPNGFPTNSLPPPAGQYVTPPGWPEFYPQQGGPIIAIQNITLRSFTMTFPPPPPGMSSTYNFSTLADLFVSWDGGHTWMPFTSLAQVQILIKGRLGVPSSEGLVMP